MPTLSSSVPLLGYRCDKCTCLNQSEDSTRLSSTCSKATLGCTLGDSKELVDYEELDPGDNNLTYASNLAEVTVGSIEERSDEETRLNANSLCAEGIVDSDEERDDKELRLNIAFTQDVEVEIFSPDTETNTSIGNESTDPDQNLFNNSAWTSHYTALDCLKKVY